MTDIVKGMSRAFAFEHDDPRDFRASEAELVEWYSPAMRAALLWLADQFETNKALRTSIKIQEAPGAFSIKVGIEDDIAAAIRAAAGEEGK